MSQLADDIPAIRDWLFPDKVERTGSREWYDVLIPDFDPLPVWRDFRGQAFFVFGSLDDSTTMSRPVPRGICRSPPQFGTTAFLRGSQYVHYVQKRPHVAIDSTTTHM